MSAVKKPKMLGELLIEKGIISTDQLRIALVEQRKKNQPLGKIFAELGFVTDSIIRDVLGESMGQASIDLSKIVVDADVLKLVSKEIARRYLVLPISFDKTTNILMLAMADTMNVVAIDQISALLGGEIEVNPVLASESQILNSIDNFYGHNLSVESILNELENGEVNLEYHQIQGNEYSHPIVRLVDAILSDAVKKGASDIHFEPEQGFLRIRYRIDGVLRQMRNIHKLHWSALCVRLKVLATMNIAETRIPQDGRFSLSVSGRTIDFRAACQPTTHGENFVLRILDRTKGIVPLDKLDLQEDTLTTLKLIMAKPEGIILVTGPTGSGKTTTLYSMLNAVNSISVNIMTLEDPVEYPLNLIRQTSVNEAVKLDFSAGIRSMMRQDPDIILVGEIRDEETAEMALRAAMTGHQVFSTLHTNSAIGAIPRLLDIGVEPHILAGNIIGIVAQRLVRRLCPHCKEAYLPASYELALLKLTEEQCHTNPIYQSKGCDKCDQQGFKGRLALIEILRFDMDIDEMIIRRASLKEILEYALKNGFTPLNQDALRRVKQGITSLNEISRVVDLTSLVP